MNNAFDEANALFVKKLSRNDSKRRLRVVDEAAAHGCQPLPFGEHLYTSRIQKGLIDQNLLILCVFVIS